MAFSFSNDAPGSRDDRPETPAPAGEAASGSDQVAPAAPPGSPAVTRFNTCRWQQPIEDGVAAFCTHREVKPYAGTTAFDPEAWCGDCQHYKLRRVPKKRSRDDYAY